MLTLFRTNQSLANIFLLPYVVLLHLHLFIFPGTNPTVYEHGLLSSWVAKWLQDIPFWANITTILLLFVQAIMINSLVIKNRLSREISLFPGLFYVLLASFIPEFLQINPPLLANTFFILSLSSLLAVYKKPVAASLILNTGIWIGIASLFYFPYIILGILGLIGLNILRAFKLRERLMLLSGVFIPFFLFGVYFFWTDQLSSFMEQQFFFRLKWHPLIEGFHGIDYIKLGIFGLILLVTFLSYGQYTQKQNIQVQKKINILYWATVLFFGSLAFTAYTGLMNLLYLTIPLSMLLSLNFIYMKKRSAETIHIILLASILYLQYKSWFIVG